MLDRNSILYALYTGETNVSELRMERSTIESNKSQKANAMYENIHAQLTPEQQTLLDQFLEQRIFAECYNEEDKFRQGFVL